jgi:polyhydroxybutyrate depolymerase
MNGVVNRPLAAVLAMLASSTVACSNSSSKSSGGDGGPSGDAGPTYDTNAPSSGCQSSSLVPGTKTITFADAGGGGADGGAARQYILHVPPSYSGQPMPLVVNMHGFLSDDSQQEAWSEMDTVADSEGFIVAYPEGAGSPLSWNAGACCEFKETSRDDAAFVSKIIDDVAQNGCVELDRVYATGMSNGGFMSQNLGCNLSDRIAAIGPVSGVLGVAPEDCKPGRAMPVMEFHGTADPLVPYDGGPPNATYFGVLYPGETPPIFASVADTVSFWVANDGCDATPMQTYSNGDATCETYSGCQGGALVTLCTIAGGGHTWPGGNIDALPDPTLAAGLVGKTSVDINASSQLWTFFKGYKLPLGFDAGVTTPPPYATFSPEVSDAGDDAPSTTSQEAGAPDASPTDASSTDGD